MAANKQILIGWAQTDITPDRPVYVAGQLYTRVSTYVHDPLTATALVLDNGDAQVVMVALDMVSPPTVLCEQIRAKLDVPGLDPQKINFSAIHTHNSTRWGATSAHDNYASYISDPALVAPFDVPEDLLHGEEADNYFIDRIIALIEDAWAARMPGGISTALDYAAIAFNRRPVFDLGDGTQESRMYGTCSNDNFIGMEGAADHTVDMLYTWDLQGNLTGIAVDVPCPSQVYELHCFLSADYWGPTRDSIREELGNVFILPLCGAAGDQNPLDLVRISKTNTETLKRWNAQADEVFRNFDMLQECEDIGERIAEAVVRGYRKARNHIETKPAFRYKKVSVVMNIRQVTEEDYNEALAQIKEYEKGFSAERPMTDAELTRVFEPAGVISRWLRQNDNPQYELASHVFRLGNSVFASNPFELFVEFGFRIRARCKATQTFLVQLSETANGPGGYLPTHAAIAGGSYSSKPASTVVGPESGDLLVEKTIEAIDSLWQ